MILASVSVRYLLTEKTNYGLGQGHSANPMRVKQKNEKYSDPSLKQVAQGSTLSMVEAIGKALVLLMVGQLKTEATAGDPKGNMSHRTCLLKCLQFTCCYLKNIKLKANLWSNVSSFCFPQQKLNLSYYFAVFGEIKLDLIFSITFQVTSLA